MPSWVRLAAVLALLLVSCGEPPLPQETLEIRLDLDPGATQTVNIAVEVSATENAAFRTWLDPTPERLVARGLEVVLRHRLDGTEVAGWPRQEMLDHDTPRSATLTAVFSNKGTVRVSFDATVGVRAYTSSLPNLLEEEASISLTRIDDG